MRIVILFASCGFALITFLISLIAYPFIASVFDFNPFALCLIIGIPLLLLTEFVTMKICKEFVLREIAGEAVLVPVGDAAKEFNGLINLNDVAAVENSMAASQKK